MVSSNNNNGETESVYQRGPWVRRIAAVLVLVMSVAMSLLILEAAGRVYAARVIQRMPVDLDSLRGGGVYQYDDYLGWCLRPNMRITQPYRITTNDLGLRNKGVSPLTTQMRILAMGDSRTFGDGVNDEETWPAQLEKALNERQPGRFEVINAGVSGWNAFQGLRYLKTRGLKLKPHMVITAFGTNEWNKALPGEPGWVEWEDLTGRSGIEVLIHEAIRGSNALITEVPFGAREFRVSPGEYTDAVVSMRKLCQDAGVTFAVLYLPSKAEIGVTDSLHAIYRVKQLTEGVARYCFCPFWDPAEVFSLPADSFYVDPVHFSPSGNRLVAGYLVDKIITPR